MLWHRHTRPLLQEVNIWGGGGGLGRREETERERQRDRVSTPGPRDQACPLPSHFFCACSGRWAIFHPVSQLQGSQPTQKGCESSYSFIPQKQALLTSCPIKPFFPDKQASTIREGGGEAHTIVMIHTLSLFLVTVTLLYFTFCPGQFQPKDLPPDRWEVWFLRPGRRLSARGGPDADTLHLSILMNIPGYVLVPRFAWS